MFISIKILGQYPTYSYPKLTLPLLGREREREVPPDFWEWADDSSCCDRCPTGQLKSSRFAIRA